MAARKQKQRGMSALVVEDEDYQLRYEVVAGIDVAKESAVICVRMPPARGSTGDRTCRRSRRSGARGGTEGGRGEPGPGGLGAPVPVMILKPTA